LRAGAFERLSVPLALVARLEEFPQSRIEHAGGRRVVQYRGRILPLASLAPILEPGSADSAGERDPAQVIVFNDGERSVGILVDQIVDIVEETISIRQSAERKGLLGSAVIGKRVTDLVDLRTVIAAASQDWFGGQSGKTFQPATVLVAEASAFDRGLARSCLEMGGYHVVEAANTQDALNALERQRIDVVVAALDLPSAGGFDLLEKMRGVPGLASIPALALANAAEEKPQRGQRAPDFEDYQMKFDHDGMLHSVANLAAAVRAAEPTPAHAGEKG